MMLHPIGKSSNEAMDISKWGETFLHRVWSIEKVYLAQNFQNGTIVLEF